MTDQLSNTQEVECGKQLLCSLWKLPQDVVSCGWYTGALGLDGAIYCAPSSDGRVLRLIPRSGATPGSCDLQAELVGDKYVGTYSGVVRGPDGNLYCIPQGALQVMRILPHEQRTELIGQRFESLELTHWGQGVCGLDGCIYCVPRGHRMRVLRIDTTTLTTELICNAHDGVDNWSGGVRGLDGRIYCVPADASQFLCIDPATQSTYPVGDSLPLHGFKYTGGVLAHDGCIYCCPRGASQVLRLDPANNHRITFIGGTYTGGMNKWVNGVLGPDGCIYCPPADATHVLRIDPSRSTTKLVGSDLGSPSTYKWCSGVLAHDGCIYAVPHGSPSVLRLQTLVPEGWVHPVGEPWVPHRHRQFSLSARQYAWQLLCVGYQLANSRAFLGRENAFLDAWRAIMSLVIVRIPF
eukprot:TRINITY_DN62377_c0_g1_i1.p1 TRINITY_DN62377_c0_g1~~TRINITY_DN62377_c0_g1_i1.p1  ORF type:complete len:408 (+),score=9.56 TRINITY_DN62377_c0_g1_i1:85-1308(+)